jgi:AbrB family looped-hinge helix DNA binding protein
MATATLTTKGQTTIPKEVREHLKLNAGDKLDFVIASDGQVILKPATIDVRDLKGLLKRAGRKSVTIEDMNAAVIDGALRKKK